MKATALLATLKGKIIAAAVGAVVVGGAATGIILANNPAYRSISVEEVTGSVVARSETRDGQLIVGEHLYSGDYVSVATQSALTMCTDNSKYLYADENTAFSLEADKKASHGSVKIKMDSGSTLHEIKVKLGKNETYEVDTPNSTMSVRGTTFRVTVHKAVDGYYYTLVEVEEGEVKTSLKTEDGEYNGVEESFGAGESALIRGNFDISEFVPGNSGDTWILDYSKLPEESVDRLIALLKNSEHDHVAGDWTVTLEPACETTGTRVKQCLICDKIMETEVLEALGHKPGDWEVGTEPGCETKGERVIKCTVCGSVLETEEIEATGHADAEWVVTEEPGCEKQGVRAKVCPLCGKEFATEKIKATGHKYGDWIVTKEPDCTHTGERKQVCATCGKENVQTVAANGHDWEELSRENPTCDTNEPEAYSHQRCKTCGATQDVHLARPAHNFQVTQYILDCGYSRDPDCLHAGMHATQCTVCQQLNNFVEEPALGHDWYIDHTRPDGDDGTITWYYWECRRCDESTMNKTGATPPANYAGH